jgi:cytoskeletal protein CcmA (bactofilin family)
MFGRKNGENSPIRTLVGEGTRIEGDLEFEGGCHIDGRVQGAVLAASGADAYLSVSEEGNIEGSVNVPRVALNGTVRGDVRAGERLELGPTARVIGNVHYHLIEMAIGAEVNGQLIHEPPGAVPALPRHGEASQGDAEPAAPKTVAGDA